MGPSGRYFTYATQYAFFMAAELDSVSTISVYSKWNAVVMQAHYEFISVDTELPYHGYV